MKPYRVGSIITIAKYSTATASSTKVISHSEARRLDSVSLADATCTIRR